MLHVAFHSLHQIGDLVVPLLEQYVDVPPSSVIVISQTHQPVVHNDQIDQNSHKYEEDGRGCDNAGIHACLLNAMPRNTQEPIPRINTWKVSTLWQCTPS